MTPCIEWTGYRNSYNYGVWQWTMPDGRRVSVMAHRLEWMRHHGPIPDGQKVCHHCDNPPCINIDHLFLGTQAQNLADMRAKGRHGYAARTHCKHGHEYTEENTAWRTDRGHLTRVCRTCQSDATKRYVAKKVGV